MRLLHISDLHVTHDDLTLNDLWERVLAQLRSVSENGKIAESLDFIVITGDLSQRAAPTEYEVLVALAQKEFVPLVRGKDPCRVIFVPGNHDVDWMANISEPLCVSINQPAKLGERIASFRRNPGASDLRLSIDEYARYDLLRLVPERYQDRFKNVQAFFDNFYRLNGNDRLEASGGRMFRLTRPRSDHWSLHVFEEQRVAFVGLNSCDQNDRFWHGAAICPQAMTSASQRIRELGLLQKGYLLIAVWHHGFSAEPGRPDFLSPDLLGSLVDAGVRVGMHGHIHRATGFVEDSFRQDIVLVSTGSLGAGSNDRPAALGNQFSLVSFSHDALSVDVHETAFHQHYGTRPRHRYFVIPPRERPAARELRARRHVRTYTLRSDGIIEIRVLIEGFEGESGSIDLARVSARHGHVQIIQNNPNVRIESFGRDHDARGSRVVWNRPQGAKEIDVCFAVSGSLALTAAELGVLDRTEHHLPGAEDADWISHQVRFECTELEIVLSFDPDIEVGETRPLVELPGDGVEDGLRLDVDAQARLRVEPNASLNRFTLSVPSPVVGNSYGIRYRPLTKGVVLEAIFSALMRRVLEHSAGTRSGDYFRPRFNVELLDLVRSALELEDEVADAEDLVASGSWMGLLWHEDDRCLRAAMGSFRPQSWAARFPAGRGIAGYSFRFAAAACWHRQIAGDRSAIYLPQPEHRRVGGGGSDYRWIACVPLRAGVQGPAVGVVCFSCVNETSEFEQLLGQAVDGACRSQGVGPVQEGHTSRTLQNLQAAVNLAFWTTIADSPNILQLNSDFPARVDLALRSWASVVAQGQQPSLDVSPHRPDLTGRVARRPAPALPRASRQPDRHQGPSGTPDQG